MAWAWANALPSPPRDGASKVAGTEEEQLLADLDIPVVNISSDSKDDTRVVSPLVSPNWEQVMIPTPLGVVGTGSSSGSGVARDLVWPQPDELGKV